MPKSTDTSEIYYTIYDDGVWLHCLQCDFNECLGFSATVTDLTAAWSKHKACLIDGYEDEPDAFQPCRRRKN